MGSPGYMAPEQVREQAAIDERADVWAFTVVFYEAIAGRPPFEGESSFDLFRAIADKDPVPTTDLGAGDSALWAILKRGLAKAPADRWPTIASLGAALAQYALARGVDTDVTGVALGTVWSASTPPEPVAEVASIQETTAPPSPRHQWAVVVIAGMGVLGVTVLTVGLWPASEPSPARAGDAPAGSLVLGSTAATNGGPPTAHAAPPALFPEARGATTNEVVATEPSSSARPQRHTPAARPAPARTTPSKTRPRGDAIDPGF